MILDTDVLIVGSGLAAAAVYRGLEGTPWTVTVLEAGPALTVGNTHLRNILRSQDSGWRGLVSSITRPPVRSHVQPLENVAPAGLLEAVRADQRPEEALPGLADCCAVGGNGLVWSGIVLPTSMTCCELSMTELQQATSWLQANVVAASPRQDFLTCVHGLEAVPMAWSPLTGWHDSQTLAGIRFSPIPRTTVIRIVHHGGRASGVEFRVENVAPRQQVIAAKHVIVCAGVVGTVRLLWSSGLQAMLPALGRGIAHHPVVGAQLAIPNAAWQQFSSEPTIDRPAAAREQSRSAGEHTLIITEPPWTPDPRVDARATLSVYAYATLDDDAERRLTFSPEALGRDGLPLPRFVARRSETEIVGTRRALATATFWADKLGVVLPGGRPRVLPRGADQHLVGGARIGSADDQLAVADSVGRLRCLKNVWVAGAAAVPGPVSTHPTLTIVALAARVARAVTASLRNG